MHTVGQKGTWFSKDFWAEQESMQISSEKICNTSLHRILMKLLWNRVKILQRCCCSPSNNKRIFHEGVCTLETKPTFTGLWLKPEVTHCVGPSCRAAQNRTILLSKFLHGWTRAAAYASAMHGDVPLTGQQMALQILSGFWQTFIDFHAIFLIHIRRSPGLWFLSTAGSLT